VEPRNGFRFASSAPLPEAVARELDFSERGVPLRRKRHRTETTCIRTTTMIPRMKNAPSLPTHPSCGSGSSPLIRDSLLGRSTLAISFPPDFASESGCCQQICVPCPAILRTSAHLPRARDWPGAGPCTRNIRKLGTNRTSRRGRHKSVESTPCIAWLLDENSFGQRIAYQRCYTHIAQAVHRKIPMRPEIILRRRSETKSPEPISIRAAGPLHAIANGMAFFHLPCDFRISSTTSRTAPSPPRAAVT
jgi:hypothetical protein